MQDSTRKPECKCMMGYTGPKCQHQTFCVSGQCLNGGTCVANTDDSLQPICHCPQGFFGLRCETSLKTHDGSSESSTGNDESSGLTWIIVLVFIVVAVSVAGVSGCMAYVVMRRKQYGFNRYKRYRVFVFTTIFIFHFLVSFSFLKFSQVLICLSSLFFTVDDHSCMLECTTQAPLR